MLRSAALAVMLMCAVVAVTAPPHRIQDGSADVCWDPDMEFPVPCEDDE